MSTDSGPGHRVLRSNKYNRYNDVFMPSRSPVIRSPPLAGACVFDDEGASSGENTQPHNAVLFTGDSNSELCHTKDIRGIHDLRVLRDSLFRLLDFDKLISKEVSNRVRGLPH